MEEKKQYSVVGRVEIGTDEYRDLIEAALRMEKSADEYRSKYWAEQSKVSELTKKVEALEAKIKKCEMFMEKTVKDGKEDKVDNDLVSIFMSMFGEE